MVVFIPSCVRFFCPRNAIKKEDGMSAQFVSTGLSDEMD